MPNATLVITGTSSGIGLGLAKYYSEKNFEVFGCSRGASNFSHKNYHHQQLNISDESDVRTWVKRIKQDSGRVDALVCNAGIVKSKTILTSTSADILKDFLNVHVLGTFLVCREVSKLMISQKFGRIINFSTLAIPLHLEGAAAYAASKSAVVEMTKILAKELAPVGITCNIIAPSLYMSPPAKLLGDDWAQELLSKQSIPRTAEIEDFANVISFLISPASSMVTGQVISLGLVT